MEMSNMAEWCRQKTPRGSFRQSWPPRFSRFQAGRTRFTATKRTPSSTPSSPFSCPSEALRLKEHFNGNQIVPGTLERFDQKRECFGVQALRADVHQDDVTGIG